MNTIGLELGAKLVRQQLSINVKMRSPRQLLLAIFYILFLVPALTAVGGIGSKYLLGLLPARAFLPAWLKWGVAHSFGTLIIAIPFFSWLLMKSYLLETEK